MGIPYVIFHIVDNISKNSRHSFLNYGLILSKQDIGTPPVKTKTINIEGAQGSIDMTEAFDEIFYQDRTLTFTFKIVTNQFSWEQIRTQMANELHGRKVQIEIYSDKDVYYVGRCFIDKYQSSKGLGTITVKCICEPFKYKKQTILTFELSETNIETIETELDFEGHSIQIYCNANQASSAIYFNIGGTSLVVAQGERILFPKKILRPFDGPFSKKTTVTIKGKGTVLLEYQERYI